MTLLSTRRGAANVIVAHARAGSVELDVSEVGEREHARPDHHVTWALREWSLDQLDHRFGDDPRALLPIGWHA